MSHRETSVSSTVFQQHIVLVVLQLFGLQCWSVVGWFEIILIPWLLEAATSVQFSGLFARPNQIKVALD